MSVAGRVGPGPRAQGYSGNGPPVAAVLHTRIALSPISEATCASLPSLSAFLPALPARPVRCLRARAARGSYCGNPSVRARLLTVKARTRHLFRGARLARPRSTNRGRQRAGALVGWLARSKTKRSLGGAASDTQQTRLASAKQSTPTQPAAAAQGIPP